MYTVQANRYVIYKNADRSKCLKVLQYYQQAFPEQQWTIGQPNPPPRKPAERGEG